MARSLRILIVLLGLAVLAPVPAATAQDGVAVEFAPTARILKGGKAVAVKGTATCPAGAEILEAFLYVNQNGNQGVFAPFHPTCDGTSHSFVVRAAPDGFRYRKGEASVSGYVLLTSGASMSPSRTVTLRHGRKASGR